MPYRIAIQLFFFLLPFMVFGIYVALTADAEREGRRKWPIQILFAIGLVLTTAVWFFKIFTENNDRNVCIEPPRNENGKIIPARTYDCERDTNFGAPGTETPGGTASGVQYPEDLRDTSDISASSPGRTEPEAAGEEDAPAEADETP